MEVDDEKFDIKWKYILYFKFVDTAFLLLLSVTYIASHISSFIG